MNEYLEEIFKTLNKQLKDIEIYLVGKKNKIDNNENRQTYIEYLKKY